MIAVVIVTFRAAILIELVASSFSSVVAFLAVTIDSFVIEHAAVVATSAPVPSTAAIIAMMSATIIRLVLSAAGLSAIVIVIIGPIVS